VGKGVLHEIDVENRIVNLTHQPIPEINWMGMTMDLPVTKRVDLSGFKANDKVNFTVKKDETNSSVSSQWNWIK
jgi:Cu/Ag efflux protein CusF